MTTSAVPSTVTADPSTIAVTAAKAKRRLTSPWASLAAVVIAVLWTTPTLGLLITSFRPQKAIHGLVGGPSSATRSSPWTTTVRC